MISRPSSRKGEREETNYLTTKRRGRATSRITRYVLCEIGEQDEEEDDDDDGRFCGFQMEEAEENHDNACGRQLLPTTPAARAPTTRGGEGGSGEGGAFGIAAAIAFHLGRALNLSSSALEGEEEEERDDREERVKGGSSQLTPTPYR